MNRDLIVDQARLDTVDETGFIVRAKYLDRWGSFDIATLDTMSLFRWCRSLNVEQLSMVVAILLGHPNTPDEPKTPST